MQSDELRDGWLVLVRWHGGDEEYYDCGSLEIAPPTAKRNAAVQLANHNGD